MTLMTPTVAVVIAALEDYSLGLRTGVDAGYTHTHAHTHTHTHTLRWTPFDGVQYPGDPGTTWLRTPLQVNTTPPLLFYELIFVAAA